MRSLPLPVALSWASHVSCMASEDEASASLMLRIRSAKDGMEPVVMALILGMVTVGDRALAVYGKAAPLRMRLRVAVRRDRPMRGRGGKPLSELKVRFV